MKMMWIVALMTLALCDPANAGPLRLYGYEITYDVQYESECMGMTATDPHNGATVFVQGCGGWVGWGDEWAHAANWIEIARARLWFMVQYRVHFGYSPVFERKTKQWRSMLR